MPTSPHAEQADPADVDWLLSADGIAVLDEVAGRLARGEDELAVGSRVRAAGVPPARAALVLDAAATRSRAVGAGYPDAARLVLLRTALEQASAPAVARHRAGRLAGAASGSGPLGGAVVDLCCGAGLDAAEIAAACGPTVGVDLDPVRVRLAAHTARVRDVPLVVHEGDALSPPVPVAGRLVHVDPGRRDGRGRRARTLATHAPPVGALLAGLLGGGERAAGVGVVVTPGVDLSDPDLPAGAELEFVAVGGALTEATLWLGDLRGRVDGTPVLARATELGGGPDTRVTLARTGPPVELPVAGMGGWLLEVAPAAVRARLHGQLGAEVGARRVARRRALLTCDEPPAPSPWWRVGEVEAVLAPRARDVRRWLRTAPELPVEVVVHGLDVDVPAFLRELGQPPRGPGGRRLHLVRLDETAVCVATRPPRDRSERAGTSATDPDGTSGCPGGPNVPM
ncbi:MAG: class I SAM-dependent methyltransferase [Actinomycetes bacterium]